MSAASRELIAKAKMAVCGPIFEDHREIIEAFLEQLEGQLTADESRKKLIRDFDEFLCGKEGMAKQASLCDVIIQAEMELKKLGYKPYGGEL